MAVETQPGQREEIELEQGGRLTRARMDRFAITEQGGKVMDGHATLVCIPSLGVEGEKLFKVNMSDDLIVPNPNQPREYFDPEKMAEMRKTIKKMGQVQPLSVVPIVLEDGTRKLFIIDGERRFRAVKELGLSTVKVIVAWASDEKKILYRALSLNLSKADHNPIEIAKAFQRAIDLEKYEKSPLSKQDIADEIGFSLSTLSRYLEYLEHLTPELQEMLVKGQISVSVADGIVKRAKEHGEKLDLGEVAKDIGTSRGNADFIVHAAVSKALRASGHGVDATRGEVRSAISKLDSNLVAACNAADVILGADVDIVLECFFERADSSRPPDVMRDKIGNLHGRLAKMMEIIEQAIEPPPALEKVPGKPDFAKYIQKKEKHFGHHVRLEMAQTLAKTTDEHGKFTTWGELISKSGVDAKTSTANIRLLGQELRMIGIELQECILRRKSSRETYAKVKAYRLAWITEQRQAEIDTSAPDMPVSDGHPRRMSDEQRAAAIKAAQERAAVAKGDKGVWLKDLEIACKASTPDPDLLRAAEAVAQNVQRIGYSYTVRGGTEFGQRLGMKIEVLRRGNKKIYIVRSNVRGFSLNFRPSARIFGDLIADALHVEKNTVTVDVQDL
ncbi:MAG: ParB/RepB/Spo0J family partition protein [Patescibacteria group bacterium]